MDEEEFGFIVVDLSALVEDAKAAAARYFADKDANRQHAGLMAWGAAFLALPKPIGGSPARLSRTISRNWRGRTNAAAYGDTAVCLAYAVEDQDIGFALTVTTHGYAAYTKLDAVSSLTLRVRLSLS